MIIQCVSIMLLGLGAQVSNINNPTVKYFKTFRGYNIPLKLVHPLSKEKAIQSTGSYYIGFFDEKDRLIKVEKIFKEKLFFTHQYEYYSNGILKRVESTPSGGVTSIKEFDEKGKEIGPLK